MDDWVKPPSGGRNHQPLLCQTEKSALYASTASANRSLPQPAPGLRCCPPLPPPRSAAPNTGPGPPQQQSGSAPARASFAGKRQGKPNAVPKGRGQARWVFSRPRHHNGHDLAAPITPLEGCLLHSSKPEPPAEHLGPDLYRRRIPAGTRFFQRGQQGSSAAGLETPAALWPTGSRQNLSLSTHLQPFFIRTASCAAAPRCPS